MFFSFKAILNRQEGKYTFSSCYQWILKIFLLSIVLRNEVFLLVSKMGRF